MKLNEDRIMFWSCVFAICSFGVSFIYMAVDYKEGMGAGLRRLCDQQDRNIDNAQKFYSQREEKLIKKDGQLQEQIDILKTMLGQLRP